MFPRHSKNRQEASLVENKIYPQHGFAENNTKVCVAKEKRRVW
jgi:hypothetical protein